MGKILKFMWSLDGLEKKLRFLIFFLFLYKILIISYYPYKILK